VKSGGSLRLPVSLFPSLSPKDGYRNPSFTGGADLNNRQQNPRLFPLASAFPSQHAPPSFAVRIPYRTIELIAVTPAS
jgi:hypothetical protein